MQRLVVLITVAAGFPGSSREAGRLHMAFFQGLSAGGLAAALRQFKESGVSKDALERALTEVYQDQGQGLTPPAESGRSSGRWLLSFFLSSYIRGDSDFR